MGRVGLRKLAGALAIVTLGCSVVVAQSDIKANLSAADKQAIQNNVQEIEQGYC